MSERNGSGRNGLAGFAGRAIKTIVGLLLFLRPPSARYEADRYKEHLGRNYRTAILLVLTMTVATIGLVGLLRFALLTYPSAKLNHEMQPTPLARPAQLERMPALSGQEVREVEASLERQRERLAGYEWVDREEGVGRIPIDRAMELMAEQGWPLDEENGTD